MNVVISNTHYSGVKEPNVCPHCHFTNTPHQKFQSKTRDTDGTDCNLQIWQCSNQDCLKLFVVVYKIVDGSAIIDKTLNGFPKGPVWPDAILNLKDGKTIGSEAKEQTKFIKTYLQSLEAEDRGLNEIAGMGYRKSIEYLVKDWAIYKAPEDKDKILKLWLGQTITEYFVGDLKDILERATWLGNDQSHYNKLFEEYDISELKELIGLIMVELDREEKKKHYIETIQKRK